MTAMRATLCSIALLAALAGAAYAHSGASGAVKQRMDAMEAIARDMKLVGRMMQGQDDFDAAAAAEAAGRLAERAGHIPMRFTESTIEAPSEARPAIWTNWEEFEAIAADMEESAEALAVAASAAAGPADIAEPFRAVAGTCKACHETFRLEK
jgi:cytochrome c556